MPPQTESVPGIIAVATAIPFTDEQWHALRLACVLLTPAIVHEADIDALDHYFVLLRIPAAPLNSTAPITIVVTIPDAWRINVDRARVTEFMQQAMAGTGTGEIDVLITVSQYAEMFKAEERMSSAVALGVVQHFVGTRPLGR